MNSLFSKNSKFNDFMSFIADLIILNLLLILCSVPVITIAPSIISMNQVTLKMSSNSKPLIIRDFFRSLRQNLKKGIFFQIILTIMIVVNLAWLYVINNLIEGMPSILSRIIVYMFIILLFDTALYSVFLFAKFDDNITITLRNAMLMSIKHLPNTLFCLLIIGVFILTLVFYPAIWGYGLMVILIFFSLLSFILSILMNKIFNRYIKK